MRLINLYIENFGGLSRYALEFETGITTVMQPNGFGKTTLAEFIRAMFYGFPRKSKTLDRSLRQKYTPWNGGQFGGNLTFAYHGQHYRIERTFGANPKGDTFAVIDLSTNRKTTRFPEEIGQALFGLDADSFERCTYLPQTGGGGLLATASILSKLSDLVEDSSDVNSFEKAVAALRAKRSALIPYRGSGGSTAETAERISSLQMQLDSLLAREAQLQEAKTEAALAQQEAERLGEQLEQIGEQLRTASRQEADRLRQQQYAQLRIRYSKEETALQALNAKYKFGLPQEELLRHAEFAAERLRQRESMAAQDRKLPTAQQLDLCRQWCEELEKLHLSIQEIECRTEKLNRGYTGHRKGKQSGSKAPLAAVAAGFAGVTAGMISMLLWNKVSGAAILGTGVLTVLVGIFMLLRQRAEKKRLF